MSFLQSRNLEWQEKKERWEYCWDNYSGEYARHDRFSLSDLKKNTQKFQTDKYLHRKVQAETPEAYVERLVTSDPVLLFPTAVDSLNGLIYGGQDDTVRDFGALGNPQPEEGEDGGTAEKLWNNADGDGTNWLPVMKQMGIRLTVQHKVWGMVDGIKEQQFETEDGMASEVTGEASIHILDPTTVVDWYPNHSPTQVLVKEKADMRTSIVDKDADRERDTYILYTLDGWTRYIEVEGNPQEIENGSYEFWETAERERRTLPIFPVELPMPRDIGYLLAIKQNHIYNSTSIRDFSVRNTSFAWLKLVANKEQYEQIIEEIKNGFRVLRQDPDARGNHDYVSPSNDHLQEAGKILDKKREFFNEAAFKAYGDAAKQATATEIRQESRSGVEAFLNLLVTTLDEFENRCLFLLEQVYFPNSPGQWGQASVERSKDFTPKDIEQAMANISTTVQNAKRVNAMSTRRAVELLNPDMTEEELDEEVQRINEERGAVEVPTNQVGG